MSSGDICMHVTFSAKGSSLGYSFNGEKVDKVKIISQRAVRKVGPAPTPPREPFSGLC